MSSYTEERSKLKKDVSEREIPPDARLKVIEDSLPPYECFPLGGFQLERRAAATGTTGNGPGRQRTRFWTSMRTRQPVSSRGTRIVEENCGGRTRASQLHSISGINSSPRLVLSFSHVARAMRSFYSDEKERRSSLCGSPSARSHRYSR